MMTEFQFNLVKTFLDGFHIPPKKLAKKWNINLADVCRVVLANNYQVYKDVQFPDEDMLLAVFGR